MGVMCTRNIRFLKKGTKGDKGDRGRLPVPYGEYSNTAVYTATDIVAPYVLCEGQYYVMNKTTTWIGASFGNKTPKQDYAQYGANATWILMEHYKAIFVELLMASFGKIASAIFYDNLMFSQQGVKNGSASSDYESLHTDGNGDVDESVASYFKPNFWVNFLTGRMKAVNADIEGTIKANIFYNKVSNYNVTTGATVTLPNDVGQIVILRLHGATGTAGGVTLPQASKVPGQTIDLFCFMASNMACYLYPKSGDSLVKYDYSTDVSGCDIRYKFTRVYSDGTRWIRLVYVDSW